MIELLSILDMRNLIKEKGFEVLVIEPTKGIFKVIVFRGEKFIGEGKHDYNNWQKAIEQTEMDLYMKISQ